MPRNGPRLLASAQIIVEMYAGKFPDDEVKTARAEIEENRVSQRIVYVPGCHAVLFIAALAATFLEDPIAQLAVLVNAEKS